MISSIRIKETTLPFLLLLSGFAGISYEVLYGRMLGNLIGDQFLVSASVLITFLLGTGVGALLAHRIFNKLWLIEFGIGLFGILFSVGFDSLKDFLYLGNLFADSLLGKILFCSILLLIPSFLIGCSIPLFSEYLAKFEKATGFSKVYAIYNFGAAFTAFGLEFVIIRIFGIISSLQIFSILNILIALALRRFSQETNTPYPLIAANKFSKRVQVSLILASIASAIFQLYMLKLTEMFFGPFRENFALVLTIILLGIAIGSILVRYFQIGFSTLMVFNFLSSKLHLTSPIILSHSIPQIKSLKKKWIAPYS